MPDLARRFASNPLLRPEDVPASDPKLFVAGVLNPGAFRYKGRIGLLLRVAEGVASDETVLRIPVLEPERDGAIKILEFRRDDPELHFDDPRIFSYGRDTYLTTVSHLRLAWSEDGEHFEVEPRPALAGHGRMQQFGVEDCRVSQIGDTYYLAFSTGSPYGICVGLASTRDWRSFERHGQIFCTDNKDVALFDEPIGGRYYALHRPSNVHIPGNHIWLASSPDLVHWGGHECIATVRPGKWDSVRIGAGAAPIRTAEGWLEIYHGANESNRYCLGAMLFAIDEPRRVIARTDEPIMEPDADYEREGFFGNVVFTNGHVVDGDRVFVYYGAADSCVCGAELSIRQIMERLRAC